MSINSFSDSPFFNRSYEFNSDFENGYKQTELVLFTFVAFSIAVIALKYFRNFYQIGPKVNSKVQPLVEREITRKQEPTSKGTKAPQVMTKKALAAKAFEEVEKKKKKNKKQQYKVLGQLVSSKVFESQKKTKKIQEIKKPVSCAVQVEVSSDESESDFYTKFYEKENIRSTSALDDGYSSNSFTPSPSPSPEAPRKILSERKSIDVSMQLKVPPFEGKAHTEKKAKALNSLAECFIPSSLVLSKEKTILSKPATLDLSQLKVIFIKNWAASKNYLVTHEVSYENHADDEGGEKEVQELIYEGCLFAKNPDHLNEETQVFIDSYNKAAGKVKVIKGIHQYQFNKYFKMMTTHFTVSANWKTFHFILALQPDFAFKPSALGKEKWKVVAIT